MVFEAFAWLADLSSKFMSSEKGPLPPPLIQSWRWLSERFLQLISEQRQLLIWC